MNLVWLVAGIAVGIVDRRRADRQRGRAAGSARPPARAVRVVAVTRRRRARPACWRASCSASAASPSWSAALAWFVLERVEDTASAADLFLAVQYPSERARPGRARGRRRAVDPDACSAGPLVVIAYVFTGIIWIVPWIAPTDSGIGLGWHLAYLVAVIAAFVGLAGFLRDRRSRAARARRRSRPRSRSPCSRPCSRRLPADTELHVRARPWLGCCCGRACARSVGAPRRDRRRSARGWCDGRPGGRRPGDDRAAGRDHDARRLAVPAFEDAAADMTAPSPVPLWRRRAVRARVAVPVVRSPVVRIHLGRAAPWSAGR